LIEHLATVMRTAEALVLEHRRVDLQGLEDLAGRLCAACLDLPPEHGRQARSLLQDLLIRVDTLEAAMRLQNP